MKSLTVLDHLVRKVLRREPNPSSHGFIQSAEYSGDHDTAIDDVLTGKDLYVSPKFGNLSQAEVSAQFSYIKKLMGTDQACENILNNLHDIYCVARNASNYDETFESRHVWAFPLWMYTTLPMLVDKRGMLQPRVNGQEGPGKFFDMGVVLDNSALAPYLRRIGQ